MADINALGSLGVEVQANDEILGNLRRLNIERYPLGISTLKLRIGIIEFRDWLVVRIAKRDDEIFLGGPRVAVTRAVNPYCGDEKRSYSFLQPAGSTLYIRRE